MEIEVRIDVETAPYGSEIIADIRVGTIFTAQCARRNHIITY